MKTNSDHKPEYHWVKYNETSAWSGGFLESIGPDARIVTTYVFDHNSSTNLCEITPSYKLHRVGTEFSTSVDLSDEKREEIEEKIRAAESVDSHEVIYIHCNEVTKSEPIRQFVDCDAETKIEEVIEYYQANPW